MKDEEILKTCELDMEECLSEMGDQQDLIRRLRESGSYDPYALAEAIAKVAALREKLEGVEGRLTELSNSQKK